MMKQRLSTRLGNVRAVAVTAGLFVLVSGTIACTSNDGPNQSGFGGSGGSSTQAGGSGGVVSGGSSSSTGAASGRDSVGAGGNDTGVAGTGGVKEGGPSGGGAGDGGGGASSGAESGGSSGATNGQGGACEVTLRPRADVLPTLYVLVDRSGSMFDCLSTTVTEPSCPQRAQTAWVKLKDATLTVIQAFQGQVRFGFAAFTGINPMIDGSGMCPIVDKVSPGVRTHGAISNLYNSLAFPEGMPTGVKYETPAAETLNLIGAELVADSTPGPKHILFITDGQSDYCDDSPEQCATDSVVGELQALAEKGVRTTVVGLGAQIDGRYASFLQEYANAGAGEPTLAPSDPQLGDMPFPLYEVCEMRGNWLADLEKTGKTPGTGVSIGEYSSTAGPTPPYQPDPADASALDRDLRTAIGAVKGCSFELVDADGKPVELAKQAAADLAIRIDGERVAPGATDGWTLSTDQILELHGAACVAWQSPNALQIEIEAACSP